MAIPAAQTSVVGAVSMEELGKAAERSAVPLSLAAVHLAGTLHHPTVFHRDGPAMERSMFIAFLVSWASFIALGVVLWRLELRGKLLAQGVQRLQKRLRGEAVLP